MFTANAHFVKLLYNYLTFHTVIVEYNYNHSRWIYDYNTQWHT